MNLEYSKLISYHLDPPTILLYRIFNLGSRTSTRPSILNHLIAAPLLNPLKELNFAGRWNSLYGYETTGFFDRSTTFPLMSRPSILNHLIAAPLPNSLKELNFAGRQYSKDI